MNDRFSVDIDVAVGTEEAPIQLESETPFRIAIFGDFSGRANRAIRDLNLGARRAIAVDRDNFDQALARLSPQLELPLAGTLQFAELDDFHPDRIYERVALFQKLRETRRRLSDPATFAEAAAQLRGPRRPPEPSLELSRMNSASLLDQTLEATEGGPRAPSRALDDWSRLLREIVAPHLVPKADPQQRELVANLDAAIGEQLRGVLHHPDFQALEAAWRAVFFLVRRLETDEQLKLFLFDVSKEELAADLGEAPDLSRSGMWRLAVSESVGTRGGQPWAVLAGNYTFDRTPEDLELLAGIGGVAARAGAPFLAAAHGRLLGCESLAETPEPEHWDQPHNDDWEMLRRAPEAKHLGLALPRFLLRLPYGKDTDPVEQFSFEELCCPARHEFYLWANPAFACVALLGEAFTRSGWALRPGAVRELDGLPVHIYKEAGESQLKPCAEVLLTDEAAEAILDRGLMPLLSVKGRDAAVLARFQSIASPLARLAGRWTG